MDKTRIIFPIVMTGIIAFAVTLIATLLNLGLSGSFVAHWLKAYAVSWPVAAATAFFAIPVARRATGWIVSRVDGKP